LYNNDQLLSAIDGLLVINQIIAIVITLITKLDNELTIILI